MMIITQQSGYQRKMESNKDQIEKLAERIKSIRKNSANYSSLIKKMNKELNRREEEGRFVIKDKKMFFDIDNQTVIDNLKAVVGKYRDNFVPPMNETLVELVQGKSLPDFVDEKYVDGKFEQEALSVLMPAIKKAKKRDADSEDNAEKSSNSYSGPNLPF